MNENEMQFSLKIYLFNCLCNDVDKREIKRLLKAIVISEIFGSPQADSAQQSRAKFIANFCVAAAAAAAQCVFLSSNTWHGNWVGCRAGSIWQATREPHKSLMLPTPFAILQL